MNYMSSVTTSIKIEFQKKNNFYLITMNHREGNWEGSSTGAKLFPVDGQLVYTSWGNGIPKKILKDIEEAKDYFERLYACYVEVR